jgi:hypothetical protein
MALRRAQALDALERLSAIEEMPVVAQASGVGSTPWHELVRETPINHVTAWAGGATPMSAAFRRRFAAYLRSASDGGVGNTTRGRMEAQASGCSSRWATTTRGTSSSGTRGDGADDAIAAARRAGGRARTSIDEYSGYYQGREGMNPTDAFLEDLIDARSTRARSSSPAGANTTSAGPRT